MVYFANNNPCENGRFLLHAIRFIISISKNNRNSYSLTTQPISAWHENVNFIAIDYFSSLQLSKLMYCFVSFLFIILRT